MGASVMTAEDDRELLDRFLRARCEAAFAELVRRYVNTVYAAALRQVRDPGMAEDVAQAVFIVLAKKAASLSRGVVLAGWLMKATHFAARDALKIEARRRRMQERYAAMISNQTSDVGGSEVSVAEELGPEIDRALARLKEGDRGAIVLRYFQGRPVAEVAAALGVSQEGATKRLQRAVGKLRGYLARRRIGPAGVATTTSAVFVAALERFSEAAVAPPALAKSAAAVALSTGMAAEAPSILIAKGAMKMIAWSNVKAAVVVLAALVVAVSAGVGTISLVRAADPPAQAQQAGAKVEDAKAVNAEDHPPVVGRLENGVSLEVEGVAPSPSGGKPGWRADGSPLPVALYSQIGAQVQGGPADRAFEVAARVNDVVTSDGSVASVRWSVPGSGASGGGMAKDAKGRQIPGLDVQVFSLPKSRGTATVRADVAAGPWRTQFSAGPDGQVMGMGGQTFHFSSVFEVADGSLSVMFVHSGGSEREAARVVAVDRAGKVREARVRRMVSSGAIVSSEYAVPVARKDLKELQFQTRVFDQWIEVRNVSLEAGKGAKVEVVTSDQ
jgi:RNA polymerase sigma factor (sigma-70 family)